MTTSDRTPQIPEDVLHRIGGAIALYRPDITRARLLALLSFAEPSAPLVPVGKQITVPQAAERLAVSTRTIWRMINDGRLPSVRIGRAVRVPEAALSKFGDLRENHINPGV